MASITVNLNSSERIRFEYNTDSDSYSISIADDYGGINKSIELTTQELFNVKDCIESILERK